MSSLRPLALLLIGYLAFIVLFPRYESDLLDRIARSEAIHQSDVIVEWIDGMTTCNCSQGITACTPGCTQDRKLDWSSPRTVATGFFAGTFVLTPFISRQLIFIRAYAANRAHALFAGAIAAIAMFTACVMNFLIGACLGLVVRCPNVSQRWARLLDRWRLGLFMLGCCAPIGFPIGLASLYLGWRHARIGLFMTVAALGCACHVFVLVIAYDQLVRLWGA